MATDLLAPFCLGFYIHLYYIYNARKPKSYSKYHLMWVCFKYLNVLPAEALYVHSVVLRLSSAYFSVLSFRQWWAALTFPEAWLRRRPRKAEETHQGSVHFFAFLPSLPPPGRPRPLPVMHPVPRWVKLTEEKQKQSLSGSVWEWPEEAAPKNRSKNSSRRLSCFPSISFCVFSCSMHVTASTRGYRLCTPGGPKPSNRLLH